jgi:hypothetical protein
MGVGALAFRLWGSQFRKWLGSIAKAKPRYTKNTAIPLLAKSMQMWQVFPLHLHKSTQRA